MRFASRSILRPYVMSVGLVGLMTVLGAFIRRYLEPTNIVMLYLMAVVFVAARWGRGPAILTSLLSVLSFDFFLIPPYFTLTVGDVQYVFTFLGLLTVGLVVSEFMVQTREQAMKAKQLELLRATEKLQKALLSSISHDLRTPLASITGSLSTLLEDAPSLDEKTRRELLEDAFEESDRLNRIVGNLLDMTRVEAGALKISPKLCGLRDVIGVSLQELKPKLSQRPVDIQIPHDLPEIPADFSLIVKVFVNLIDNAAKYSPEGTPVRIHAKAQENKVRVEVSDEGVGIQQEDLTKIFDKFYRAVKPDQISGTGLGLSICKGIVEAHSGELWAESNSGKKGATFVVVLPLAR